MLRSRDEMAALHPEPAPLPAEISFERRRSAAGERGPSLQRIVDCHREIRLSRKLCHRRLQPCMHRVHQRSRSCQTNVFSFIGRSSPDIFLDPVQRAMRSSASFATGDRCAWAYGHSVPVRNTYHAVIRLRPGCGRNSRISDAISLTSCTQLIVFVSSTPTAGAVATGAVNQVWSRAVAGSGSGGVRTVREKT